MHCPYCGLEMECIKRYAVGERQTIYLGTVYGCKKCDKMFDQAAYRYLPGVAHPIPIQGVKWEEGEMKWGVYKKKHPKEKVVRPGVPRAQMKCGKRGKSTGRKIKQASH